MFRGLWIADGLGGGGKTDSEHVLGRVRIFTRNGISHLLWICHGPGVELNCLAFSPGEGGARREVRAL